MNESREPGEGLSPMVQARDNGDMNYGNTVEVGKEVFRRWDR